MMRDWNITIELFDKKEQNEKALLVIKDVLDEFCHLIPSGPVLDISKIIIVNDFEAGPTLFWPKKDDFYTVALNVADVNYKQIAFQFSQELCRIYSYPRITNWLIYLLTHVAALYSLEFLGYKWKEKGNNDELKDYWKEFEAYKNNILASAFTEVDMVKYQMDTNWLKNQVTKLQNDSKISSAKILIMANELLPLFKDSPKLWNLLPLIGKSASPPPPEDNKSMVAVRITKPDFELMKRNVGKTEQDLLNILLKKMGIV